ncbi:E3 ubiquitin-protein ligase RNF144A isoform X2 [Dendrobates tinctorius]|uniref:E3 ubiquitin-protein ligase RNF144A isoform X2 n=1 Tax=Dendrobates tinctorius TaxID=92724 RepID=UPI003CC931C5
MAALSCSLLAVISGLILRSLQSIASSVLCDPWSVAGMLLITSTSCAPSPAWRLPGSVLSPLLLRLVTDTEEEGGESSVLCAVALTIGAGCGCLKQYVELLIKEGLETAISCPDAGCPKRGHLQENEIECMVAVEIMQRYKKLQFEREVLLDPCRTWCPSSSCQAVCKLQEKGPQNPQLVQCTSCDIEFCSSCKSNWHPGQGCQENMPITFLPGESSSALKMVEDDIPIKRCPKCKVYIERDEGCAQMMCKNCKHAFCWYCLESLDLEAVTRWQRRTGVALGRAEDGSWTISYLYIMIRDRVETS